MTSLETTSRIENVDKTVYKERRHMTNTELLKKKIKDSGLKVAYIAESIKLSRAGLYKKINNDSQFNQYEIEGLCKLLDVKSLSEKELIFFGSSVD